jgi:hypothetical protein
MKLTEEDITKHTCEVWSHTSDALYSDLWRHVEYSVNNQVWMSTVAKVWTMVGEFNRVLLMEENDVN